MNEARAWDYSTLYYSFWPSEEYRDGPVISAAGLADSMTLRTLLDPADLLDEEDYLFCAVDQPHDFKSTSPLLRAIERQRPENIRVLLEHDANSDGVPIIRQMDLARRVRRFCHNSRAALHDMEVGVAKESVGTVSSQTSPPYLTDDEMAERRSTLAPFWAVPCCFGIDYSMEKVLYHSVVMAGQTTPEILDQLLNAGADSSAWRTSGMISLPSEDELQPSQLSISTPLHTAIATNNLSMLRALLDRGFSPDARAMISGSQALTPLQYAIVIGDTASCSLVRSRGAGPGLRTPVFDVHALHYAAALLRIDLLYAVGLPLSSASTTAIGHTLLHIATLPYNKSEI
jgi:ankyrin repeat protein